MKRKWKNVLATAVLALCLAAFSGLLVACSPDNPPEADVTYTVTVKADADTPAEGVNVAVYKGTVHYGSAKTDSNGKATFKLPADSYTIALTDLPEHRVIPEGADLTLTAEKRDLTVTLEQAFAYVVKLVNVDDTAFTAQGVQVGICTATNCLEPVELGADGTALIEAEKGNYHVQIKGLGDYAYECDENGYYTGKEFTETVTEMTIKLYPCTELGKDSAKMTDAQKEAYTALNGNYYSTMYKDDAYEYKASLGAGTAAYYKYTPEMTAYYTIFALPQNNCYFDGNCFTTKAVADNHVNHNGFQISQILEAGKTYYLQFRNNFETAENIDFIVIKPAASYEEISGVAKNATFSLTVTKANANAIVAFTPTATAKYTATVKGNALAAIDKFYSEYSAEYATFEPEDFNVGASMSFKVTGASLNTACYIAVQVQADKFPQIVTLEITNDAVVTDTLNEKTVTATLTDQNAPEKKVLYPVPVDVEPELDGGVYYTRIDGVKTPIVVNLTNEKLTRIGENYGLAYLDQNVNARNLSYVITQSVDDLTTGDTLTDYRVFLRGFKDYDMDKDENSEPVYAIPTTGLASEYYAKHADENGCYPLTEELADFLKVFYDANFDYFYWKFEEEGEYGWLFACYYYDDNILGKFEDEGSSYRLTVESDKTFTIIDLNDEDGSEFASGTWTKTAAGHTFTFNSKYADLNPTMTYSADNDQYTYSDSIGLSPLTLGRYKEPADVLVGEHTTGNPMLGLTTFTVNDDGTFSLAESMGSETGTWKKTDETAAVNTYSFTAEWNDYIVTLNLLSGEIIIYYADDNSEKCSFNSPEHSLKTDDDMTYLFLYEDGSFELYTYDYVSSYILYVDGTYEMEENLSITIGTKAEGIESVSASFNNGIITVTVNNAEDSGKTPLEETYVFDMYGSDEDEDFE